MRPELVLIAAWVVWAVSWMAAALWSRRTAARAGIAAQSFYRALTIAGAVLLLGTFRHRVRFFPLWHANDGVAWALDAVAVFGFAFCWWARLSLGSLWSGTVTRKEGHRVVDTGPYAIVRHPIYTGLITAALATAGVEGTLAGLAGALLFIIGYWIKARLEERFLRQELGPEAYDSYRRRVPMLMPFGPKSA